MSSRSFCTRLMESFQYRFGGFAATGTPPEQQPVVETDPSRVESVGDASELDASSFDQEHEADSSDDDISGQCDGQRDNPVPLAHTCPSTTLLMHRHPSDPAQSTKRFPARVPRLILDDIRRDDAGIE